MGDIGTSGECVCGVWKANWWFAEGAGVVVVVLLVGVVVGVGKG